MIDKNKIKQLKYLRFKPEEKWFLNILFNLKGYTSDTYPVSETIFYKKDNNILFVYDLKTKIFYCSYENMWVILESEFDLKNQEIVILIKNMTEEHLKLNNIIPELWSFSNDFETNQKLNLKEI